MTNKDKSAATWSDVKAKLGDFDRAGLLGLVQDLHTTSKDNQNFLHTRLGLGCDVLKPYKTIIERWLWPDVYKSSGIFRLKGQKANHRLQESLWPTGGYGRADSVLLRAGHWL